MECRVTLKDGVASVFFMREGELIPVVKKTPFVRQEFESDGLTFDQQTVYKKVLGSEIGARVVNQLKNNRVSNQDFKSEIKALCPWVSDKLFEAPLMKMLCEPRVFRKVRRKVINSIDENLFNRLSFKELGITKLDVLAAFRQHQLINF